MQAPTVVPEAVIDAIAKRHMLWIPARTPDGYTARCPVHGYGHDWSEGPCICTPDALRFERILKELRWNFDHYCFISFDGMHVDIELDGNMHT